MPDLADLSGSTEPVEQTQAGRKARFCLATGVQPSEYDQLTLWEIEAFMKALEEQKRNG